MIDFAPGMRTIIRDEEWMVKKIETKSLGNKTYTIEDDFDPFEALISAAGEAEAETEKKSEIITDETLFSDMDYLSVPVHLEMTKSNGAPLLWVLLCASKEADTGIMESFVFNTDDVDDDTTGALYKGVLGEIPNENLVTKILFGSAEPPRFIMLIGMNQVPNSASTPSSTPDACWRMS